MSSRPSKPPLLGALMRIPLEAVHQRIIAEAHAAGFDDLVQAHLSVLRYPGPDDRRPSELATEAGMSKQAMNYLLGQLEDLGYLVREDDPLDRRSKRVALTTRGHDLRTTIRASVDAIEAEVEAELGPKQFAQLRRLLVALNTTAFVRGTSADVPRPAAPPAEELAEA